MPGKSTLLNQILGQKIAIVSDKPQTTRKGILGIYTTPQLQAVFVDTPGMHKPLHKLGAYMMQQAEQALNDADLIFYLRGCGDALWQWGRIYHQTAGHEKKAGLFVIE